MTVVEAYIGKQKINPLDNPLKLHSEVSSLLCEGIAQNTTGNVFVPKVAVSFSFVLWFCDSSLMFSLPNHHIYYFLTSCLKPFFCWILWITLGAWLPLKEWNLLLTAFIFAGWWRCRDFWISNWKSYPLLGSQGTTSNHIPPSISSIFLCQVNCTYHLCICIL
jgi:hypothetical protein